MDGASRGKLGLTGIGGVLHNCRGEVLIMFSRHEGVCDSNAAEVLAILEALWLFSRNFSDSLIVESDLSYTIAMVCKRVVFH